MQQKLIYVSAVALLFGCLSIGSAAAANKEANNPQQLVNDAANTVIKIESNSHYDALLKRAKGVFVIPSLVKGALLLGGQGAQGVLLKHNADGSWSDPAFLTVGSVSLGLQAGGKPGPAAMILMTDKALNDFTQANNFLLNGYAGLTIIDYSAVGQAPVGKGDIVLWSDQWVTFAGTDLSAADIVQNTVEDKQYYGHQVSPEQVLHGDVTNPAANKLRQSLPA